MLFQIVIPQWFRIWRCWRDRERDIWKLLWIKYLFTSHFRTLFLFSLQRVVSAIFLLVTFCSFSLFRAGNLFIVVPSIPYIINGWHFNCFSWCCALWTTTWKTHIQQKSTNCILIIFFPTSRLIAEFKKMRIILVSIVGKLAQIVFIYVFEEKKRTDWKSKQSSHIINSVLICATCQNSQSYISSHIKTEPH